MNESKGILICGSAQGMCMAAKTFNNYKIYFSYPERNTNNPKEVIIIKVLIPN